ncbi:MAG: dethiobiotin synthase [bacterium]
MARGIFVTGTDTCVGKTVITGLLARYFLESGHQTITQKWIQTGSSCLDSDDIAQHLHLMGKNREEIRNYLPYMLSYSFKYPSSPHLAAAIEKKEIKPEKIKDDFKFLAKHFDIVIVEGTGGVLVPFSKKGLILDIVEELRLLVIIVAKNKLGAINHTLLTIEAVRKRGLDIIGVIFNNLEEDIAEIILEDNPKIISNLTGEKILGILPYLEDNKQLYELVNQIGEKLLKL